MQELLEQGLTTIKFQAHHWTSNVQQDMTFGNL